MPRTSIVGTSGLIRTHFKYILGENVRATETYTGTWTECKAGARQRGTWGAGELLGFQLETSEPSHNGDEENATLTNIWQWSQAGGIPLNGTAGADLPPDIHSCVRMPFDAPVEKLWPYKLLEGQTYTEPLTGYPLSVLGIIRSSAGNPFEYEKQFIEARDSLSEPYKTYANDLYSLLKRGTTNKQMWLPKYAWISHHWSLPVLDGGGYCTSSPGGPGGAYLPPGFDWLKAPDEYSKNGAVYQVMREWQGASAVDEVGSPVGWDPLLYPHP